MYPDPPLSVRLKRHLRDTWIIYLGIFAIGAFFLFFDFSERPQAFRNPFRWIWDISPVAYGVVVYGFMSLFGVAAIFAIVIELYSALTGRSLFNYNYRTSRDLLEIRPKRSTLDPTKDRGDKSDKPR